MSHPIPGNDYGEETRGSDPRLNAMQKAMGKFLDNAGNNMKKPNENHLEYLKRITKHKALGKKKGASKKLPRSKQIDYYKNDEGYRDDQD